MIRLYGFNTQNTLKALYVLEESGLDFEFEYVDLAKGEQRSDEFAQKSLMRKVPLLEHDGEFLFESGAICRYIGNLTEPSVYPVDKMQRARVDQWMDFFSCQLGRWLTTIFYETVIKKHFNLGEPDAALVAEGSKFVGQQLKVLNAHLADSEYLANDVLSIADLFAFAYVEQCRAIEWSLTDVPNVEAWLNRIESRVSVASARARFPD